LKTNEMLIVELQDAVTRLANICDSLTDRIMDLEEECFNLRDDLEDLFMTAGPIVKAVGG